MWNKIFNFMICYYCLDLYIYTKTKKVNKDMKAKVQNRLT